MIRVWVANAVVLETFEKEVQLQSWVLTELSKNLQKRSWQVRAIL